MQKHTCLLVRCSALAQHNGSSRHRSLVARTAADGRHPRSHMHAPTPSSTTTLPSTCTCTHAGAGRTVCGVPAAEHHHAPRAVGRHLGRGAPGPMPKRAPGARFGGRRDICPSAHQVRVLVDGGRCSTAGNLSHAKRLERRATAYREVSKGGGRGAPGHLPKCTRCATLRAGVHTHIHTQPHTHRLSLSHTHTIARAQVYTAGGAASWELPRAAAPLSAVTAALRRLRTDAGG